MDSCIYPNFPPAPFGLFCWDYFGIVSKEDRFVILMGGSVRGNPSGIPLRH